MKNPNPSARQFTLVEIMVVIVIIALILGITVPAFNSLATGSSVDAAASMIASQLRLARAEAAMRREIVGIEFKVDTRTDADNRTVYVSDSWEAVHVDDGNATDPFPSLPDTKREHLPSGALLRFDDAGDSGVHRVCYRPSGMIDGDHSTLSSPVELKLVQGMIAGNGRFIPLHKDGNDAAIDSRVKVNVYTGDVTVER